MDLSAKQELWEKLAGIEMRLQLMSKLIKINVGFADVEEFNLGLRSTLKNPEKLGEKQDRKTVRVAMEGKMHDELIEKRKSMRDREDENFTSKDVENSTSSTARKLKFGGGEEAANQMPQNRDTVAGLHCDEKCREDASP